MREAGGRTLRTKSCCFQLAAHRNPAVSKGTRLATASFAAPHESVDDDDDSWLLSATQKPSRESSSRRRRAEGDDAPEETAIGACLLAAS